MHKGLQSGFARAETYRRLADVLIHHHRHALAIYEFVNGALNGEAGNGRRMDTLEHARRLEVWSEELDLLQLSVTPSIRPVLLQYLDEVGKIAKVVRLESADLDTSGDRLTASLEAVLRRLHTILDVGWAVDKSHSDTLS